MMFYIPPFWCGVIATVIGEVLALIVAVIVRQNKQDKSKFTFKK